MATCSINKDFRSLNEDTRYHRTRESTNISKNRYAHAGKCANIRHQNNSPSANHIYSLFLSTMQPLLLLHGAIGAPAQLQPLSGALHGFHVHTPCFSGHAGMPIGGAAMSIELFAQEVISYMDSHGIATAPIVGYSMGGYVGAYLAHHHPARVSRLVTLATKYQWDPETAAREVRMLDPNKIEEKLPDFANTLRLRHAPLSWDKVLHQTAQMMLAMGNSNPLSPAQLALITLPVLVLLGDRDKMVTLDETIAAFRHIPNAQLGILPGTPHPIEQMAMAMLANLILRFLNA